MNGARDPQVPPATNLAEVGKALRAGGNRDVTIREMPGLEHLFQTAATGQVGEYGSIEETFARAAPDTLGTRLAARRARVMRNRLGVLRAERDWSPGELAERLGVSRQTVNAIETERYDPSLPLAFRIAKPLGRRIEEIFEP